MCGIAGAFAYAQHAAPVDREELLRIREAMRNRGPDGSGLWIDANGRIGLAHRRLAIIDLSDRGAQPMATADGKLVITYNGEIYNYRELRRELEAKGFAFRTQSDTEVLLHLYADRGVQMVNALRGMFAFAIWDVRNQTLLLARDPFGIKPLYYSDDGKTFCFASQVKALLKSKLVDATPEPAGSVGFMVWGFVPEPFTLYRGIRALPAGCHMLVQRRHRAITKTYFNIRDELVCAEERSRSSRDPGAMDELCARLRESVKYHLVSDVPVGVFLSSGIDSTTVAALAAAQGAGPLHTLTLGFREYQGTSQDEAPLAEVVARQVRSRHETRWISRENFQEDLKKILDAMDQPTTDGVNTYLVSKAAAQAGMKVALSGLGGDELFGGYPSFRQVPRLAEWLGFMREVPRVGRALRRILAPMLRTVTSPKFAGVFEYGGTYGGAYLLRRALFMPWELNAVLDPDTVMKGLEQLQLDERLQETIRGLHGRHQRVAALELAWYMRNQLLRDADWAGMAHSLEIRVPMVDIELFRTAAPLMVSNNPPSKGDIVRTLANFLPAGILSRAKTGFATPVSEWTASSGRMGWKSRGLRGWATQVMPARRREFRALSLVSDAFGGSGGIALYNRDFLNALCVMPECDCVVAVPRSMPNSPEPLPEKLIYETRGLGGKWRYALTVMSALLRYDRFDVVICGHINMLSIAYLCSRLLGARLVLMIYGIDAWHPHRSQLVKRLLRSVHQVISISDVTASRFSAWSLIDRSRIAVIPNAIHKEWYGPGDKNSALVRRYGLQGKTVIMTLGRLVTAERYKGFDEVLELMPRLTERVPNLAYLIVGDGTDRQRLEGKARSLGLEHSVVFAGAVPEHEKADHYRLADAYVMPSQGEGFGFVLLEAMACGIPAIGSKLDGTREALKGGELGMLVDPTQQDELEGAIVGSLRDGRRGVPNGLDDFSYEKFRIRAAATFASVLDH